jgi:hypothetical protein
MFGALFNIRMKHLHKIQKIHMDFQKKNFENSSLALQIW